MISGLEQINQILSPELSYLRNFHNLWQLFKLLHKPKETSGFGDISKTEKLKHINQSCLHARYEMFTFLVTKTKGRYIHITKLDKSLHLKELQ